MRFTDDKKGSSPEFSQWRFVLLVLLLLLGRGRKHVVAACCGEIVRFEKNWLFFFLTRYPTWKHCRNSDRQIRLIFTYRC